VVNKKGLKEPSPRLFFVNRVIILQRQTKKKSVKIRVIRVYRTPLTAHSPATSNLIIYFIVPVTLGFMNLFINQMQEIIWLC
jgi:hypothetical protein